MKSGEEETGLFTTDPENIREGQIYRNIRIREFINRSSHDLKGPLASLLGLIRLAKANKDQKKLLSILDLMEFSTLSLDEKLSSLLDEMKFSDTVRDFEILDIHSVIMDVLRSLEYLPGISDVEIVVDVKEPVFFSSHRNVLCSIIQNIIENAVKYRNRAVSSSLTISVEKTNSSLMLAFRDNGIGMEKNVHEKIFQRYFRGISKVEGSGLGLYHVRSDLKRLNATIVVESEPGNGSVFRITIPDQGIQSAGLER